MNNYFRSWHKPAKWYKTKRQPLSNTWCPTAIKTNYGVEVIFTSEEEKRIVFVLSEENAARLIQKLNSMEFANTKK